MVLPLPRPSKWDTLQKALGRAVLLWQMGYQPHARKPAYLEHLTVLEVRCPPYSQGLCRPWKITQPNRT